MDLRNTIKQLQEENRQLASAMTQLSNGMSPAEVQLYTRTHIFFLQSMHHLATHQSRNGSRSVAVVTCVCLLVCTGVRVLT